MTHIGAHLLGRNPSPPDARDWQLERFLSTDPVDLAYQALMKSTVAKATKNWATAVMPLLGHTPPAPPPPAPSGVMEWADVESVLDQGDTGTCVGNGGAQWGNCAPVDDKYTEADARQLYLETTTFDYGSPDNTLQKGATVRSLAKVLLARKRLTAYAFASTTDAITAWVTKNGPVIVGTDWLENMFTPDEHGFVSVSGGVAGGHCYLLHGYDPNQSAYKFLNSWGAGWGLKGHFYMRVTDFAKLLAAQGEALVALEVT